MRHLPIIAPLSGVIASVLVGCSCGTGSRPDVGPGLDVPEGLDGGGVPAGPPRRWSRTAIEGTGVGITGSVDGFDVAYFDTTGLVHATYDGATLVPTTIVPGPLTDTGDVAITRDAMGHVHLAWTEGELLRYATDASGAFVTEPLPSRAATPTIAVGPDGVVYVAYLEPGVFGVDVSVATRVGGSWSEELLGRTRVETAGGRASVRIAPDGTPTIAAASEDGREIVLRVRGAAGGWTSTSIHTPTMALFGYLALAFDPAGQPVVAFTTVDDRAHVLRRIGGAYVDEEVAPLPGIVSWIDLAVASTGSFFAVTETEPRFGGTFVVDGIAILERTDGAWGAQALAPRSECRAVVATSAANPAVALSCGGQVYLLSSTGLYPEDWSAQCSAAAATVCARACSCGSVGDDCCWQYGFTTRCTSNFGCSPNMAEDLCGDPTIAPAGLSACASSAAGAMCVPDMDRGMVLSFSPECAALVNPIGL